LARECPEKGKPPEGYVCKKCDQVSKILHFANPPICSQSRVTISEIVQISQQRREIKTVRAVSVSKISYSEGREGEDKSATKLERGFNPSISRSTV
jgi:hypothetical protein